MTNPVESPITFDCEGDTLVGVVTTAAEGASSATGLVILPGGPNYRAGAHRQFVQLARRAAAAGVTVLRFDYRGMGDSDGAPPGFERVAPDIAAALDALQRQRADIARIVLCGLCEGASSALIYCHATRDPRIAAVALLNPWVRSETTLAKTYLRHYYLRRLASRAFWSKLLRGNVHVTAAARDFGTHAGAALAQRATERGPAFPRVMAAGLRGFAGPVLVALSADDLTAREFVDHARNDEHWRGLLERPNVTRRDIEDADHTFSSPRARDALEHLVLAWLAASATPPAAGSHASPKHPSFARG